MKRLLMIGICFAALVGLAAAETVYESKDAQGNPVFSDQPHQGAKAVELKPVNTTPALVPRVRPSPQQAAPVHAYTKIDIDVPSPIPNGLAPTTVGIVTEPALWPGDRWQLKLDGQTVASGTGGSATIPTIARGDHTLELEIINGGGVVGSSGSKNVFVYWPGGAKSRLSPTPH